ncbi:CBO0543 family protein [Bacillus suaedaesalsae]|uniref:Rod shape-determining protein MreD n=1 Tax=Bacillus suaedaesalsae TaxID=2810349 RepID=A0ABS2DJT7_9BACI|nr:CBO0543 family protein [Bacillus suaedaesalsae]MBM6618708.1 hypothetical protein [Bacillus suaedaesalsae]
MELQTVFIYTTSVLIVVAAFFIPKKIKLYELYTTSIFATLFGLLVDTVLAVKYKTYVLDKPGIQIPPLIGQVVLYFCTNILLLNFYPFNKPLKWRILYVLFFTLLTVVFEFTAYIFGFIKYNEWKIWYSALSYPFLIYFLLLHYKFFLWLVKKS